MASNDTIVTIRGWAGADPTFYSGDRDSRRLDKLLGGHSVSAVVNVGVTPRNYSRKTGQFEDGETAWYSVRTFGRLAEHVAACVHKGTPLLVRGKLTSRTFQTKEGISKTSQVIVADAVGVEISMGVAQYIRESDTSSGDESIVSQVSASAAQNSLPSKDTGESTSPVISDAATVHDPWESDTGIESAGDLQPTEE